MPKKPRTLLFTAALLAGLSASLHAAPTDISSVGLTTSTAPNPPANPVDGYTYDNTIEAVTSFTSSTGQGYTMISSAPNTFVQRSGTPNQSSVWYAISASTGHLQGVNQTNYGTLLKSNNLLEGADNTFVNTSGTAAAAGNIERLDYTWSTPLSNLNALAFAVFDRGAVSAHDAFTIAIITGVDANGNPTSYGGFLKVASGWGAAALGPTANPNNQLLRYANGDNISANDGNQQTQQGVGGIVVKLSDVTNFTGSTVYGYSLMGADVNPTTASDLLRTTDTSVYPNNTADANGGIDLVAVNGVEFRAVPEPTTPTWLSVGGLVLVGGSLVRRKLA